MIWKMMQLNSLRKINSDMKLSLYLPSISNSNIKDDSFNNSIPKRKGYKLNTEKKKKLIHINYFKMKVLHLIKLKQ